MAESSAAPKARNGEYIFLSFGKAMLLSSGILSRPARLLSHRSARAKRRSVNLARSGKASLAVT